MNLKNTLNSLLTQVADPAVTISLNTHRTHPDNTQDSIVLKNLIEETKERLIKEYGKRDVSKLLTKLDALPEKIDHNYNLDSLHIFLSDTEEQIIRLDETVHLDHVYIGPRFATRPLIKAVGRTTEYLILLVSQWGVQLYHATNDSISEEVREDRFPFSESPHYTTHHDVKSQPEKVDNLVREFLNQVDKAAVRVSEKMGLDIIVIATEDNYSRLLQVADRPSIYLGYSPINYNDVRTHTLAKQAYEMIAQRQYDDRTNTINEMREAVATGNVYTDLGEIYRAAIDGRGELLIVHEDFIQPVEHMWDRDFTLVTDTSKPGIIDDMGVLIAEEVYKKGGRVIYTQQEELAEFGLIVLKTRY